MKIISIKTGILKSPLKVPFKTAVRTVNELIDVIVRIDSDTGLSGWGSAAPTAKVTGDTIGSIMGAIDESIRSVLLGRNVEDLENNLDALDTTIMGNTSAKAAIDIALHDLWARSLCAPAWKLFGGSGKSIETDITISINSPEEMARDSLKGKLDGFNIIKTKVGVNPNVDFARLKAIRETVGSDIKIRIDANQGWEPPEAVRILNHMQESGLDLELVEQPVKAKNLEGLAYVTANSPIPVVADESCWSPADALHILSKGTANIINIKLMKCAGIRHARQIISIAQAMGTEVMMGCMLEGKISCAAAISLASSFPCVTRVDIDGPLLCSEDFIEGGPIFSGGSQIHLTNAHGFGVTGIKGLSLF